MTKMEFQRRTKNISQTALSRVTGISNGDISKMERGYLRPYPSQAARLALALDMAEGELLDEVEVR